MYDFHLQMIINLFNILAPSRGSFSKSNMHWKNWHPDHPNIDRSVRHALQHVKY